SFVGGFRIDPSVLGPGWLVASGHAEVDRAQPRHGAHAVTVERVGNRHLAQLHIAGVFHALASRPIEVVPKASTPPILANRDGIVRARANYAGALLDGFAEDLG